MAIGAYTIDVQPGINTSLSGGRVYLIRGKMDRPAVLRSITMYIWATSGTITPLVYDEFGARVSANEPISYTGPGGATFVGQKEVPFTTPVELVHGKTYYIGYHSSDSVGSGPMDSKTEDVSTPSGFKFTEDAATTYFVVSSSVPNSLSLPVSTTASAVLDSISVDESPWNNYSLETTSATQSGTSHIPILNHTFETTTEGWQANNFFGTYKDPTTIARTSTRAKTGTYALEVTFPQLVKPEDSRVITQEILGFVPGSKYVFEADVYVESGGPDVRLDAFLQPGGHGPAHCLDKGSWRHLSLFFTAGSQNIYLGINTTTSAVFGKKIWIDNAIVKPAPLESGNYVLQVRTADAEGFGPWSTNATFAVNTPPTASGIDLSPKRVGGNINVTWNYLDINSNPQAKYQIKYRKK